jgi:hypothetical protein
MATEQATEYILKDEFQQFKSQTNKQQSEITEKLLALENTKGQQGSTSFKATQEEKKKSLGLPFSPMTRAANTNGFFNQIKVPPSVWAAALQVPLISGVNKMAFFFVILPALVALFFSGAAQVTFLYYMHDMVRHLNEDDFGGGPTCDGDASSFLKFVATSVFLSYGFGTEFSEALLTNRWLSAFPDWDENKHAKVIEDSMERDGFGYVDFQLVFQEATNDEGQSALVPAVGLSQTFKWYARFVFVLVRMVIAGGIMVEAAGLIFYSPTNLAVLGSAVAATFVLDIDNYVYQFLVTDLVKIRLATVPPIGVSEYIGGTGSDGFWQVFGSYLLIAVLLSTAGALEAAWCEDGVLAAWLGLGIPILCCTGAFACCARQDPDDNDPADGYREWPMKDEAGVEFSKVAEDQIYITQAAMCSKNGHQFRI